MIEQHFLVGKRAINPSSDRNVKRLKKRNAKFVHISAVPVYVYDEMLRPAFAGFEHAKPYRNPNRVNGKRVTVPRRRKRPE